MAKPNWKRFQTVVHEMINTTMGAETCTIKFPSYISYDSETGEHETQEEEMQIQSALIPTNKDDLKDLPEGYRTKVTKKIFTIEPIPDYAKIISDFNGEEFEVIIPSVAYQAGGLTHCYRTFIGKIETTLTANKPKEDEYGYSYYDYSEDSGDGISWD